MFRPGIAGFVLSSLVACGPDLGGDVKDSVVEPGVQGVSFELERTGPLPAIVIEGKPRYVADEILFRLPTGMERTEAEAIAASVGGTLSLSIPLARTFAVRWPTALSSGELAVRRSMLKAIPTVESSFFNYFGTLAQQDDNTDLDDRDLGWAWDAIQFRAAARFLSGTSVPFTPVRIGVIDTGCDRTHREFQGVTFAPWSASADPRGHGTSITSLIGARNHPGEADGGDLAGIVALPGVPYSLSPHSALSYLAGFGWNTDRIALSRVLYFMHRCVEESDDVVNMSLGFNGDNVASLDLVDVRAALETIIVATKNKILWVVAAGNQGRSLATFHAYPAGIEADNILTVAATDRFDRPAYFSNIAGSVDVSAPGHEVFAATKGSAYDSVSGTSFAAPLVAGAAALVSSILGDVSPVTIAQLLKSTMDPLGDGLVGRLNLARAVREALSRRGLASSLPLLRIVEGSLDGTLAVRSDDTPSSVHSTSIGEAGMADLDLSPDGDRVFGLRWDGMVVALRRAGAGTGDAPVSAASLALGHDPIVSGKIRISSDGRSAIVLTVRHSDPEPVVLSIWVLDIADTGEDLLLSVRAGYPIHLPQPETTVSLKIGGLAICPRPMDEEEGIRPLPRAWFSAVSGILVLSGTEIVEQYVESRMFEIGLESAAAPSVLGTYRNTMCGEVLSSLSRFEYPPSWRVRVYVAATTVPAMGSFAPSKGWIIHLTRSPDEGEIWIPLEGAVYTASGASISRTGKRGYFSFENGAYEPQLVTIDPSIGTVVGVTSMSAPVWSLAVTPDGNRLLVGLGEVGSQVRDAMTLGIVRVSDEPAHYVRVAW